MTLNPKSVGRTYRAEPFEITKGACMLFALAAGDCNLAYLDGRRSGGIVAPPMFAAVYARTPTAQILNDREVGIEYGKVLHYRQAFHWQAAVRPNDVISTVATITAICAVPAGELLEFETVSTNQRGEVAVKGEWTYLMRGPTFGEPDDSKSPRPPLQKGEILGFDLQTGAVGAGEPDFEVKVEIPPWQTFAYAEASGDRNPLHIDPEAAAARGFKDVVVHGLCTLSLCHPAVADALCREDPTRIQSLSARFSKPVFPGSTLTFQGRRAKGDASSMVVHLRATDDTGQTVLKDAFCIVTSVGAYGHTPLRMR